MNRQPPRLATWLLRHREALAGDLLERYNEGESDRWFWRQVLTAILVNNWPQIVFSIAGAPTLWFCGGRFLEIILSPPLVARTWYFALGGLQWTEPLVYDQVLRSAAAALMIQPILAVALLLGRAFRWASLVRTFLVSTPLIAATVFLWIITGIASSAFYVPLILCSLLISARIGCRPTFPDRTARALATVAVALFVLHAMSGPGARWGLDRLNESLFTRSYYVWEILMWVVPLQVLLIAAVCGWIVGRFNRSMVALLLVLCALSFTNATVSSYFLARFFAVVLGILLGATLAWKRATAPAPPAPTPLQT